MSTLRTDTITNAAGSGAPTFSNGLILPSATDGYYAVSDASGLLSLTPGGLGSVTANDSNVIFTSASNRTQICTPTATRTYTLPTTSIVAGEVWTFYNQATSSANYITIQSSGGNTVCILPALGKVILYSAVATPTTAANWIVSEKVSQWVAYTPTISAGFGTATSISFFSKIINDDLLIKGSFTNGTVAGSLASVTIPTGFTISSTKSSINNTTSNPGPFIGNYSGSASTGNYGALVLAVSTSTSILYFGITPAFSGQLTPQNGNSIASNANITSLFCKVPIVS